MNTEIQHNVEVDKTSLRRSLPKIDDDGLIDTGNSKSDLYRKRILIKKAVVKPKYDQVASMYIMLRDDQGEVPEQIQITDVKERRDLLKAGLSNCRVFQIKSIGQHIHDWVKKIGPIWVTHQPDDTDSWVNVKAAI